MFDVILAPSAAAFYEAADRPLAAKLARCFKHLETTPKAVGNVKRLRGDWAGYFRYRIGDWRVIYRVNDHLKRVDVLVIAHRRDVYES